MMVMSPVSLSIKCSGDPWLPRLGDEGHLRMELWAERFDLPPQGPWDG